MTCSSVEGVEKWERLDKDCMYHIGDDPAEDPQEVGNGSLCGRVRSLLSSRKQVRGFTHEANERHVLAVLVYTLKVPSRAATRQLWSRD
jgi:hypothetical protein